MHSYYNSQTLTLHFFQNSNLMLQTFASVLLLL